MSQQKEVLLEKPTMKRVAEAGAPVLPCGSPFSEEERNIFRNEDYGAASLIV